MNHTKVLAIGRSLTLPSVFVKSADDFYSFKVQSFITFLQEAGLIKNAKEIHEIDSVTISCSLKNGLNVVGKMNFINFS